MESKVALFTLKPSASVLRIKDLQQKIVLGVLGLSFSGF